MSESFTLQTAIWQEEAEPDNPFAAARCFAHGYDVYGELIHKASWFEYLLLLFLGEKSSPEKAQMLEKLAIAIANPGPREASVRAAMNGGVGGSVRAASLMSALAVGAGQLGGAHEVEILMAAWQRLETDLDGWKSFLVDPNRYYSEDGWSPIEHPPGLDPNGISCPEPVRSTLAVLANYKVGLYIPWLQENRAKLEDATGLPLTISAVAAACFADLGLNSGQAAMLYLIMRLPGAAVHALEQEQLGWKKFPAYGKAVHLTNDPGPFPASDISRFEL